MAVPQPDTPEGNKNAGGDKLPSKLKLAFSKAADHGRISRLFSPAIKSKIDPHNFVVKRERDIFDDMINGGHAAFFYDTATGQAHTLSMAYHIHDHTGHIHTEIGSSLTGLAGFHSAQVIVAALALKEWWQNQPSGLIVTEILPENGPSLHLYHGTLGWEEITDEDTIEELADFCNQSIAPEDRDRAAQWFTCPDSLLPQLAQILLDYMDQGTLYNRRTNTHIDLDLSALEHEGLTRHRLELIARGVTYKAALIGNPPPAPGP